MGRGAAGLAVSRQWFLRTPGAGPSIHRLGNTGGRLPRAAPGSTYRLWPASGLFGVRGGQGVSRPRRGVEMAVGLCCRILASLLGRETQHGSSQFCPHSIAGADLRRALGPPGHCSGDLALLPCPTGCSSPHFSSAVALGLGKLRTGLPVLDFYPFSPPTFCFQLLLSRCSAA